MMSIVCEKCSPSDTEVATMKMMQSRRTAAEVSSSADFSSAIAADCHRIARHSVRRIGTARRQTKMDVLGISPLSFGT
jgi:hypothetical protein